jgi:hypothetical protein
MSGLLEGKMRQDNQKKATEAHLIKNLHESSRIFRTRICGKGKQLVEKVVQHITSLPSLLGGRR